MLKRDVVAVKLDEQHVCERRLLNCAALTVQGRAAFVPAASSGRCDGRSPERPRRG